MNTLLARGPHEDQKAYARRKLHLVPGHTGPHQATLGHTGPWRAVGAALFLRCWHWDVPFPPAPTRTPHPTGRLPPTLSLLASSPPDTSPVHVKAVSLAGQSMEITGSYLLVCVGRGEELHTKAMNVLPTRSIGKRGCHVRIWFRFQRHTSSPGQPRATLTSALPFRASLPRHAVSLSH